MVLFGKAFGVDDFSVLRLSVFNNNVGTTVTLSNASLDGNALGGPFSPPAGSTLHWLIGDYDFPGGFTLTATLDLTGTFTGNEVGKLELTLGPIATCGNGVVEPGEDCDSSGVAGACCDVVTCQFATAGTSCSDDGDACTGDVCGGGGICTHLTTGNPCGDDGNVCTDDICAAGVCTHPANAVPCDDGLACTSADTCAGTQCSGTPVACPLCQTCNEVDLGCAAGPRPTCMDSTAKKAKLIVKDRTVDKGDVLVWKWNRFDKYKDVEGTPNGVAKLSLLSPVSRGKANLRGKGELLPDLGLPLALPVTVQRHASNGACWSAEYSTAKVATSALLKAVAD